MIETLPAGTVLRRHYRIERVLGSGGFGHVYLATDLTTNQQCAIKEYLVTGENGQEQLKHEAKVLSQLHHENLPRFLDAFIERERYYVAISYIEGHDLTDILRMARQRNETIATPQLLNWVLAVCNAVMFMHQQKPIVIHRDIKPDNIRITPSGMAVLVDLGNAKAVADGARTLFFIRNQGTPGYAPPEQYPGGAGTDARSDVYALGGTLYFVLTAHEPPNVTVRNQAIQQGRPDLPTLQEIIAKNPPEESEEAKAARQFRLGVSKPGKPAPRHSQHIARLGQLPPQIIQQLDYIIQKAMAMRPRDRYQFVADFANDLKNVIRAFPVSQQLSYNENHADAFAHAANAQASIQQANSAEHNGVSTQPMPPDIACPRCNLQLPAASLFCPRCGTRLTPSMQNSAHTPMLARRTPPAHPNGAVDISDAHSADSSYQSRVKISSKTPVVQQESEELSSHTPLMHAVPHRSSQVTPQARSLQQNHVIAGQHITDRHTATKQHNRMTWVSFIIIAIVILLLVILLIFATQGSAHTQVPTIFHEADAAIYFLIPAFVSIISRARLSL